MGNARVGAGKRSRSVTSKGRRKALIHWRMVISGTVDARALPGINYDASSHGHPIVIVFELTCSRDHRFEGWFASALEFERQYAASEIACPVCSDIEVRKVPSARIKRPDRGAGLPTDSALAARAKPASGSPATNSSGPQQMTLAAFIDHVLVNSEDVGARFAEEARKIHRGEAPRRSIRGQATPSETEALLEEGVPVLPLPVPPKDTWQ
jgi:hypothetical protein